MQPETRPIIGRIVAQHPLRRLNAAGAAWRAALVDLLIPPHCAFCDAEPSSASRDILLCDSCVDALTSDRLPRCRRCAARTPQVISSCAHCRARRYPFAEVIALGSYQGSLRDAVLRMKWVTHEPLAASIARLLARPVSERLAETPVQYVVPMPTSWQRRLRRGTSSTEILADEVARHLSVPLARRGLVCTRNTLPQGPLRRTRRIENVRGAYRAGAGYHFNGARVLLVDDVLTTGASCSEATRVLRRAGASEVIVAVAARTELPV